MSGTPSDPAALDAKLDRILGQLTTINNRLNSHDTRLARMETGKLDAGKGGGEDAHHGGGEDDRDDTGTATRASHGIEPRRSSVAAPYVIATAIRLA